MGLPFSQATSEIVGIHGITGHVNRIWSLKLYIHMSESATLVAGVAGEVGVREVGVREGGPSVNFDDFYLSEFAALVALAAFVSGSRASAEDIAQEAMLDAHRRWERIGFYDSPRGWVRRVTIQRSWKVANRRRSEHVSLLRSLRRPTGDQNTEPFDEELLVALRSLPDRQRAVVALHYLDDISVAETAEMLDISVGSVKTHLFRARAALLIALGDTDQKEQE